MSTLEIFFESLVHDLWRASWQVAALILLVLLVQRLLGRWLSPRWSYALWLLVGLRLALPVLPELPGGVLSWEIASELRDPGPTAVVEEPRPRPLLPRRARNTSRPPVPEVTTAPDAAAGATEDPAPPRSSFSALASSLASAPAEPSHSPPGWIFWTGCIWVVVGLLRAAFITTRELAFRRRLRREPLVRDGEVLELLARCRAEIGVSRGVKLIRSDLAGGSPAATGLIRPAIVLPSSALRRLSREELRSVLLHELAHHRHADVVLNAAIALFSCVWWFHPLVGIAFARLRAAQELLRDWEALSTARSPAPTLYAEVLLKLAEAGGDEKLIAATFARQAREIRRRILMIADFQSVSNRPWAVGAGLVLILGWLTFTSATSQQTAPPEAPDDLRHVEVVRHQPAPEWRARVEAALDSEIEMSISGLEVPETLEVLRAVSGLPVHGEDALLEHGPSPFELEFSGARLRDVLRLISADVSKHIGFGLVDGAIVFSERDSTPEEPDLRFYKVETLLEETGETVYDLIELVQEYTGGDSWEYDRMMIDVWTGLLVIRQTEDVHRQVGSLLDRLLNDGRSPETESQKRRAATARELERVRGSFRFEDQTVEDTMRIFSEALGRPVIIDENYEGELASLELQDVTLARALEVLARQFDLWVSVEEAGVVLAGQPRMEVEFYDLSDLLERVEDESEFVDGLEGLIRDQVSPDFWELAHVASIRWWNGRLLVEAIPEVHEGVAQLVDALQRVLD